MKLSKEGLFRRSVHNALAAGAACTAFTGPAAAQQAAESPTQLDTLQITGSRLPQPNLTSTSSYTIVNDQELDFQGTVNIEGLLNRMPQVFAEFSTGDSNGATGTATVSLRGLGSNRTLVMIDGKRLMPGDPFVDAPDLNFIPAALIDNIEILSGGSSAVYGSDAVAGVVNFKMKRDFEGFRIDTQGSTTSDSDGTTRSLTAVWGTNVAGGRGNVTVYGGYVNSDAITQADREFSACSITTPAAGNRHVCAGSFTIPTGRIYSYDIGALYLIDPAGTRAFVADDLSLTFNFAPFNYFQRPQERYMVGGFAHRELAEGLDLYADLMYMDDRTIAQIAPSGLFFSRVLVDCTSPFLSAQQANVICPGGGGGNNVPGFADLGIAKRLIEVGPRQDDLRHTDTRFVVGARGAIGGPWKYDVSYQRGEVVFSQNYLNDVSVTRAQQALNGCPSGSDDGCVPLDVFQVGAFTPAMGDFIRGIGVSTASVLETVTSAVVTADLGRYGVRLPTANAGIGFALGVERRTEELNFNPDFSFQNGDLAGQGGSTEPVSGTYNLKEIFTEIQVPLVEDAPGARLLMLDGAFRHSNISSTGDANTYKGGLQYTPVADVAARVSFQRATRAPTINEFFLPINFGLFGYSDPCAGSNLFNNANRPTQQQCANTGVPAGLYQEGVDGPLVDSDPAFPDAGITDCSSGQCNGLFRGNTALQPELSDTFSFGVVFTPGFVRDLSVTLDYFDISIDNAIRAIPAGTVNSCLNTGDPTFCSLVHRNPVNGRIWGDTSGGTNFVDAQLLNTAKLETTGVDLEVNYKMPLAGAGGLGFNFVTTYLLGFEVENAPGSGTYDCAGLYGIVCGNPSPEYRHKFRTTWSSPMGVAVSLNWRYFGDATLDTSQTGDRNLGTPQGANNVIDRELKAKQYFDLSATYALPWVGQTTQLRVGVTNLLEEEPQVVSSNNPNPVSSPPFGNGNTFPNIYDVSRVFFLGLTADF